MKYIIFSIILNIIVNAGEINRAETIVNDIETLREDYSNNKHEKSNNKLLKLCKTKEKKNNLLINKYLNELKNKDKLIKALKNQINLANKTNKVNLKVIEKEIFSKASTFRTVGNSDIYNRIDGDIIYQWKDSTAFTSNVMTQNWVRITGYFINGKWKRAKQKLWIKKTNIVKR